MRVEIDCPVCYKRMERVPATGLFYECVKCNVFVPVRITGPGSEFLKPDSPTSELITLWLPFTKRVN